MAACSSICIHTVWVHVKCWSFLLHCMNVGGSFLPTGSQRVSKSPPPQVYPFGWRGAKMPQQLTLPSDLVWRSEVRAHAFHFSFAHLLWPAGMPSGLHFHLPQFFPWNPSKPDFSTTVLHYTGKHGKTQKQQHKFEKANESIFSITCMFLCTCVFVCERVHKHFGGRRVRTSSGVIPQELSTLLFTICFSFLKQGNPAGLEPAV